MALSAPEGPVTARSALFVLLLLAAPAQAAPSWTVLFNGKNLDNFDIAYASKPVDSRPASALFEVKDGIIHTYPGQQAGSTQAAAYFQTRDTHRDFVLHLEYKWGENKYAPRMHRVMDAGLVFHIYDSRPNNWPYGVEYQIEDGNVADLWLLSATADVATKPNLAPRNPDPLQDNSPYYAPDGRVATQGGYKKFLRIRHAANFERPGWNSVDVVVRGDSAVYLINGEVGMRLANMKKWDGRRWVRLDHGKILFQAEYADISYRDIKIRPVTESDPR
jgi:hypothetical protein